MVFGMGCVTCGGSGFRGRTAIGEAFLSTEVMLRAIAEEASAATLADLAVSDGFVSMAVDGCRKAVAGLTTIEEVVAAVHV